MIINRKKNLGKTSKRGFTVLELIISMSLFIIISALVVGSFITAMRTQSAIMGLIEAKDNMNIALERMAREARMGTYFQLGLSQQEFSFIDINGNEIRYFYDDIDMLIKRCENFNCLPIVSSGLKVENFSAVLYRNLSGSIPPRITVSFLITPTDEKFKDYFSFNIQTTVSARQL